MCWGGGELCKICGTPVILIALLDLNSVTHKKVMQLDRRIK